MRFWKKEYNHKIIEDTISEKDLCLKWFETEVSKNYKDCSEKSVFNDKELSRK